MWPVIAHSAAIALGYFCALFLIAQWRRDNSLVDMGWGLGFVVVTSFAFFSAAHFTPRALVTLLLVAVWGFRLTYHIVRRNWGKPEDFRYAQWREKWGRWVVPRAFIQVFMLQALFLLVIVYPVLLIQVSARPGFGFVEILGVLIWVVGFLFEAVGDRQLARFRSNPQNQGKVLRTGLWRYTRHPNYFGEATMWWGLFVIALSVPWGWTGIIGPLTITLLLRFVSGVPMLEKKLRGRPEFDRYARVTNAFVPWFPKREARAAYKTSNNRTPR
ncbi:MAG: DUF1295 domain-containing protein [Candidatus Bipolaricaulota bacterium]